MKYIASCSFGKDSLATTLLALEHGEPLDEAVFVEVMFDHTRGISGEIPEHIDWIYSTAIPRLAAMGVRTRVLRSERDYMYFFYKCRRGGRFAGKLYGFPIGGKCTAQRDLKINPMRRYIRSLGEEVTQYIGIASDEPKRLARLQSVKDDKPCKSCKVSLLAKYGYTEAMARELCESHGLLSPIYKTGTRGGCWFCPNARVSFFCRLRREHPDLWAELKQLSYVPNLCSYGFRYGKTLQEVEREMDLHDARLEAESRQLKLF